jgi:hypothetical protein
LSPDTMAVLSRAECVCAHACLVPMDTFTGDAMQLTSFLAKRSS